MIDFFEKYAHMMIPEPNTGCLIWLGAQHPFGYGEFTRDKKKYRTHRTAYEAVHGVGSLGRSECRHTCDLAPCCNPDHLIKGTHLENMQDAFRRNRMWHPIGENASQAVITEVQALAIREMGLRRCSLAEIAKHFPLERKSISALLRTETWAHLGPAIPVTRSKRGE